MKTLFYKLSLVLLGLSASLRAACAETVTASWYETGTTTANGESYDPEGMTCAHRKYPFGTMLKVTYRAWMGSIAPLVSVVVRVNDRGPFVKGRGLDLSRGAFQKLAPLCQGLIKVRIEVLSK